MNKERMTYLTVLLTILFILMCGSIAAVAAAPSNWNMNKDSPSFSTEDFIKEQLRTPEMSHMSDSIESSQPDAMKIIFPGFDAKQFISDLTTGKNVFDTKTILWGILQVFASELGSCLTQCGKIIILIILCAILQKIQSSFGGEGAGEAAFFACYILILIILIGSFNDVVRICTDTIDGMTVFMQGILPLLITLIVSSGSMTAAAVFQPILLSAAEIGAVIMKGVLVPVIFISTVLSVVDNVSGKLHISRIAAFVRQITGIVTGLVLTIFVGVVSVQGSLGAVVDGVTSKTAKYAINTMVPFAGKYLSDAAETVMGCTLLVKNAAGVAGVTVLAVICLAPALKIAAVILIYRALAAVAQPVSDERIIRCINDMATSMTYLTGIMISVSFMFLLSVTMLVGAGNISAMIR